METNSNGVTTHQKIIDTALSLFKGKGYDQTTLNDICDAAGVSVNTFYYYFNAKDALLEEIFRISGELSSDEISKLLSSKSSWMQIWLLTRRPLERSLLLGSDLMLKIFQSYLNDSSGFAGFHFQEDHLILSLIQNGQASGEIQNRAEAGKLLYSMQRAQIGVLIHWCISGGKNDLVSHDLEVMESILSVAPKYKITPKKAMDMLSNGLKSTATVTPTPESALGK